MAEPTSPALPLAIDAAISRLESVKTEVFDVIFGQEDVVEQTLTVLLAGGHALILGLPGLAKTRLVSTISKIIGLDFKRVQCTPDLMPSDMIGAEILEEIDYGRRNFRFVHGPIFCQFLMVDEINRASPRTQAALLQAMEERHVTVAGREHALPTPFHVLATLNPLEMEGTYPLPEAQLDRFLFQIEIGYPSREAEKKIVESTLNSDEAAPKSLLYASDLRDMQQTVRRMPFPEAAIEAVLSLIHAARPDTSPLDIVRNYVHWGPGPRASRALALAMRARALIKGRADVNADDLKALIRPVLNHRMALNYAARADNVKIESVLEQLTATIAPF